MLYRLQGGVVRFDLHLSGCHVVVHFEAVVEDLLELVR